PRRQPEVLLPYPSFDQDVLGLERTATRRRHPDPDLPGRAHLCDHPGQRAAVPQPVPRGGRHGGHRSRPRPRTLRQPHRDDAPPPPQHRRTPHPHRPPRPPRPPAAAAGRPTPPPPPPPPPPPTPPRRRSRRCRIFTRRENSRRWRPRTITARSVRWPIRRSAS